MHFVQLNGRRYACFDRLACEPGLVHAFSTRPDDVAARDDSSAPRRHERRRQMARDLGLDPQRLAYCAQVHTPRIAIVEPPLQSGRLEGFDAVITAQRDTPLMTFSADCPLVLLYDRRGVVGLVHASWRCTVARAVGLTVAAMRERFGSDPGELLAGIGPSAGPEQYEVQADVLAAAASLPDCERCFPRRDGRMFFDLWTANRLELERAGLRAEHIELAGICTMTHNDVFYSFRREGAGCGHFGLMAGLRA